MNNANDVKLLTPTSLLEDAAYAKRAGAASRWRSTENYDYCRHGDCMSRLWKTTDENPNQNNFWMKMSLELKVGSLHLVGIKLAAMQAGKKLNSL